MKRELMLKTTALKRCSIKADDGEMRFSGYASVFGGVDSYGDTVIKGAYAKTLVDRERPILLRWNHHGPVIGKFLELKEDDTGLYVDFELTKGHSTAEDTAALLRHGAIDGLSIGYYIEESKMRDDGVLELQEISLREISVVEEPADPKALIEGKSAFQECKNLKDVESVVRRDYGFSRSDATAIVAKIKQAVEQSDSAGADTALIDYINTKFGESS